jgi:hypothetical protein
MPASAAARSTADAYGQRPPYSLGELVRFDVSVSNAASISYLVEVPVQFVFFILKKFGFTC